MNSEPDGKAPAGAPRPALSRSALISLASHALVLAWLARAPLRPANAARETGPITLSARVEAPGNEAARGTVEPDDAIPMESSVTLDDDEEWAVLAQGAQFSTALDIEVVTADVNPAEFRGRLDGHEAGRTGREGASIATKSSGTRLAANSGNEMNESDLAAQRMESRPATAREPAEFHAAVVELDARDRRYPEASRRHGEAGTVELLLTIGEDGELQAVQTLGSSGYERLDRAAVENLRHARIRPATLDGVPVASTRKIRITFVAQ